MHHIFDKLRNTTFGLLIAKYQRHVLLVHPKSYLTEINSIEIFELQKQVIIFVVE